MNNRLFLLTNAAVAGARGVPLAVTKPAGRRVLTLVYDKSFGMMRAIDRIVG